MRHDHRLHQIARPVFLSFVCLSGALAQGDVTVEQANRHLRAQEWAQAAEVLGALAEREPDNPRHWLRLGFSRHQLGEHAQAIPAYERAIDDPRTRLPALYNLACAEAMTGGADRALELLGVLSIEGGVSTAQIKGDSDFAALQDDERFVALLESFGAPPEGSPARQFDFWVGDWDVHGVGGQLLGRNIITKRMNGWIIHEAWTGAGGGAGESINFYDIERGTWRQFWMSETGGMTEYEGEWRDGAIRYGTGRHVTSNGSKTLQRSSFAPLEDGRVRQFIESSSDGGETWTPSFEGYYTRRTAASEG